MGRKRKKGRKTGGRPGATKVQAPAQRKGGHRWLLGSLVVYGVVIVAAVVGMLLHGWSRTTTAVVSDERFDREFAGAASQWDEAVRFFQGGSVDLARERARASERTLRGMIEQYPKDPRLKTALSDLLSRYGVQLDQHGQTEESIAVLQEALAVDPDNESIHLTCGITLSKAERDVEAIRHFRDVQRINPGNTGVLKYLAKSLGRTGDFDAALEYYEKAAAAEPENPRILNNMSTIYFRRKDNDKAIELLTSAVEAGPEHMESQINLSRLLFVQGDRQRARDHAELALELAEKTGGNELAYQLKDVFDWLERQSLLTNVMQVAQMGKE